MKKQFAVCAIGLCLSACSTGLPLISMSSSSTKYCDPREMQMLQGNSARLYDLREGMMQQEVVASLGQPASRNYFHLYGGAVVEAYFYQVSSTTCDYRPSHKYMYEPVFMQYQTVIGIGHDYYKHRIKPYLASNFAPETYTHSKGPNSVRAEWKQMQVNDPYTNSSYGN